MARVLQGIVVSNKMDKTAVVAVTRVKNHPLYRKKFKITKRFMVADPDNTCQIGQAIQIVETRPQSRHKRWAIYNGGKS